VVGGGGGGGGGKRERGREAHLGFTGNCTKCVCVCVFRRRKVKAPEHTHIFLRGGAFGRGFILGVLSADLMKHELTVGVCACVCGCVCPSVYLPACLCLSVCLYVRRKENRLSNSVSL